MRMSTRGARFSKRRSRRKTSFPLVAVVQKRSKAHYISAKYLEPKAREANSLNKFETKETLRKSVANPNSVKKRSRGTIDYKNIVLLRKLITSEGKILPRRINKLTAKQQRYTSKAIKSARIMGLLPFINKSRSFNV